MTEYIWPLVAALGLVLAYSAIMRWLGNASRADVRAIDACVASLRRDFDAHRLQWDGIGMQWRDKVIELESKVDRVVIDAKNEIAGSVAQVADITKKGWR